MALELNKYQEYFANNQEWKFIVKNDIAFLQSNLLLESRFKHGFFTKCDANNGPIESSKHLGTSNSIHKVLQKHSNKYIYASKTSLDHPEESDGIISDKSKQSLWVYSADCIPILIADRNTGITAACHAGWRGIEKKIVARILEGMITVGCQKNDIIVALGPAISGDSYQVDLDVANKIIISVDKLVQAKSKCHEELYQFSKKNNHLIIRGKHSKSKWNIDLREATVLQLQNFGIKTEQISVCPLCTFKSHEIFYSKRRGSSQACQWSGIISNTPNTNTDLG